MSSPVAPDNLYQWLTDSVRGFSVATANEQRDGVCYQYLLTAKAFTKTFSQALMLVVKLTNKYVPSFTNFFENIWIAAVCFAANLQRYIPSK